MKNETGWKQTSLVRSAVVAALAALLAQGCQPDADADLIRVEANDLGVSHVQIERSAANGERLLVLRGLDEAGEQIALTTLRTGMVSYTSEPGLIPEEWSKGTELTVTVGNESMPFVNPTLLPYETTEPREKALASFIRLKPVASELKQEAGISFVPRPIVPAGQEAAYAAGNCQASVFPSTLFQSVGDPAQCCRESTTGDTWHKINAPGQGADGHIGYRKYGNVCRNSDGTTGCGVGGTACAFGPCGSWNQWGSSGRGGTNASKVFVPTSQPTVCGYQYYSDPTFGTVGSPETYGSQTLYGGVTGSCQCTLCSTDGTPRCGFFDNFNRSSGLGSNWSVSAGSFSTDGSAAVANSANTGNFARIIPTFNTFDYSVTAKVSVPAGAENAGVVARGPGTSTFYNDLYEAVLNTNNGGSVEIWRRNSGNWTLLGLAPVAITAGTYYTVKLVATGSNPVHLEAWFEGTKKIVFDDFSSSRITTGYAGIVTWDSNTKWNDIQVTPEPPQGSSPPAPPAGSPFVDDFNRTDSLGLGTNWIVGTGSFTTNGTRAVAGPDVGSGCFGRVVADLQTNNYSVTASVSVPSSSYWTGVFARSPLPEAVSSDLYAAKISTSGGGEISLYRRNDWTWTQLGSTVSTTITAGTFYTIKLVATGSNPVHLEAWIGGVKKIDVNDSSASRITSGSHGIFSYVPAGGALFESHRADAM